MKKILIIDDEAEFCRVVKQNLEMKGDYRVEVATDGKGGIDAALRNKPDLILLDIIMPGMGGFDVLRELKSKKETTSIPVIMLTAVDSEEAKEKALGLYDEEYIVKPVLLGDLDSKIKAVLSRRF
ncbi:MAG: response regulator [Candidatus Omnitrophica bacterium]|nr:response regulator [Candidatus Omnitrophota bacterium]